MSRARGRYYDSEIRRRSRQAELSGERYTDYRVNALRYALYDNYYTKEQIHDAYQAKGSYLTASDMGNYYTKVQSDDKYQPIGSYATTTSVYTKAESDNKYQLKGDYVLATMLTAYYTKTQMDTLLLNKVNKANPKTQLNTVAQINPYSGAVSVTIMLILNLNVALGELSNRSEAQRQTINALSTEVGKMRQILIDAELARA